MNLEIDIKAILFGVDARTAPTTDHYHKLSEALKSCKTATTPTQLPQHIDCVGRCILGSCAIERVAK